jgi:hypothetical protein
MEYHTAVRMDKLQMYIITWVNPTNLILSDTIPTQREYILYDSIMKFISRQHSPINLFIYIIYLFTYIFGKKDSFSLEGTQKGLLEYC